jgi:hypothetical protein
MSHRTKAVRTAEKALSATLAIELRAIGKAVAKKVSRVAKAEGDDVVDEAVDAIEWEPIAGAVMVQLTAVAKDGSRRALVRLGVADDESITEQTFTGAVEWAKARSAELVGKSWNEDGELIDNPDAEMAISDTIRDDIRDAVADAIEAGDSAAELGDAIEELGSFSEARALLIARSELVRANNNASITAMRESGVVRKKGWSTSTEDSVCDECQENEDAGDIDIDEDFPSGDDCPIAHPGCMCVITASIEEGEGEAADADAEDDSEDDSEDEQAAE